MLSLDDQRALDSWEEAWLDPDHSFYAEDEDNDEWLRADDEAEERFCERMKGEW